MAAMVQEDGEDVVGKWVDQLTEKARAIRAAGLTSLTHFLEKNVDMEALSGKLETIVGNIKTILKKAKGEEFEKACACAQVLGLSVDETEGKFVFEELYPVLCSFSNAEAAVDQQSEHAIRTLATLCFFCNEEADRLANVMRICEGFISGFVADEPKIAALQSWGFLATLFGSSYFAQHKHALVARFLPLLSHECLDVQTEAGENLALVLQQAEETDGEESSEEQETAEEVAEQGIVVDQSKFVMAAGEENSDSALKDEKHEISDVEEEAGLEEGWLDDLVQRLEDLSYENNKGRSKRDQKELRSRFREIVESVRDGEQPQAKIQVDRTTITLENWPEIRRLQFVKLILRDGFSVHLKGNGLLHQAFDLHSKGLDDHFLNDRLVNMDGRSYYGVRRSKAEEIARHKARAKREAVKGDFLAAN